jgi:putative inorganic carbon (hco3(-)) transporter
MGVERAQTPKVERVALSGDRTIDVVSFENAKPIAAAPALPGETIAHLPRVERSGARIPSPEAIIVAGAVIAVAASAFAASVQSSHLSLLALAAVVLLPYAALAAHDARRVLLAAVMFDVVLQWDVNFGWNGVAERVGSEAARLGAEGGLNVSLTTFALAGLYALWVAERGRPRSAASPLVLRPALPLLVYVGISGLSIAVARDPVLGGYRLALLVQTLLLFVYITSTVRTRADVLFLITTLMAALLVEGILMLALYATGARFDVLGLGTWEPAAGTGMDAGPFSRVGGTMGGPNTAASVLGLLLPAALGVLVAPVGRPVRRLALAALAVGVPALIVTGSRGGWVSFVVSFAILAVVAVRHKLIGTRAALGTALAIAVFVLPVGGVAVARVSSNDLGSASSRVSMARLAAKMIADRPLLGVGLSNVPLNIPDYAGPEFTRQFLFTIHDKYLLVASEAGIGALIAFVWFLAATVVYGLRCLRSADRMIVGLAAGLLAGLFGTMVHMYVDIFQSRAQVQVLWLMAGLLAAMALLSQTGSTTEVAE